MAIVIEQLGVSVEGQVTRRYDKQKDRTTISFTEEQVREVYEALGEAVEFFDRSSGREPLE